MLQGKDGGRHGRGWEERGKYGWWVGRQPPCEWSWRSGREEKVGKREG